MIRVNEGKSLATFLANSANCVRWSSSCGVYRPRVFVTATKTGTPSRRDAAARFPSVCWSYSRGSRTSGHQKAWRLTARKPASLASAMFAFASTRLVRSISPSFAPTSMLGPPACAGAARSKANRTITKKRRTDAQISRLAGFSSR